ncbi:SLC13 family permease [Breoghania sp.]|uniref:SLC13 family permease n=1 Tax=Breoghania sp. TaxID=2065378 RepID=UPI002AA6810B|nr:SLC13 family permease [Breoghania sp.]
MAYFRQTIVGLILLLAIGIALTIPGGLSQDQALTFGIVLITLSLWATGLVPGYVASTFFFAALLLGDLAAPEVVFSGFTSTAMWLIVTGFVIGAAITHSGLGARLGELARPHLSRSYPMLIGGLMVLGMALGFVMPSSMGRAAVLVPVGMALADVLGFARGSAGRTGTAVVIAFGTNMPSFAILPSNIPNVILSGMAERLLGVQFGYAEYLLLHYPVLGLVKSAVIVALVLFFFPARIEENGQRAMEANPASGKRQLALMGILLITLALWASDQFHGLNPAWVGLAVSLVLMTPKSGFVPPLVFKSSVDFGTLLFVSGALALGVVVNASGLGAIIAREVTGLLPLQQGQDFVNFMSLSLLSSMTSIFTTMPGVPAILTPLANDLSQVTGFSQQAVLMTQVIGFSTVIFPYQIGPLIVAMGLAGESTRPLLRMTLALTLATVILLIPLDYAWWKVLGLI